MRLIVSYIFLIESLIISLNKSYGITENKLCKQFVGERRLKRCAKADAEKAFADILEMNEDILETFAADNVMYNYSTESQNFSQNSSNISEHLLSDQDIQLFGEISDDDDSNNKYLYVRRELLEVNIGSDGSSSNENEENDDKEEVRFKQWLREWNLKQHYSARE